MFIFILILLADLGVVAGLNGQAASTISSSPGWLVVYYQNGGVNNPTWQNLTLSNSGSQAVSYILVPTVDTTVSVKNWLIASPSSGTIPANGSVPVMVGYDATKSLPTGIYYGHVTVLSLSGSQLWDVPVELVVFTAPLLKIAPTALHFCYGMGGKLPAEQIVTPTATSDPQGGQVPLTISTSTTSGGALLLAPTSADMAFYFSDGTAFPVAVTPQNLPPGEYQGTVTVAAVGAENNPQTVAVALTVVQAPVVQTSANLLFFPYQPSFGYRQNMDVTSNTGGSLNYTASATASTCGPDWLVLRGVTTGTTNGTLVVIADPTGLAPATCSGTITVNATDAATGAASSAEIPVTMYVSNGPLFMVTPPALSFTAPAGSQTNLVQYVTSQSTGGSSSFGGFSYWIPAGGTGSWLEVLPLLAGEPPAVTIIVKPGQLSAGTYTGVLAFNAPLDTALVPVTLQVTDGAVTLNAASLSFTQAWAGPAPPAQNLGVASSGPALNYVAGVSYSGAAGWLSVSPPRGTGVATSKLSVSVDGSRLPAGTYQGVLTVTAFGMAGAPIAGSPATVNVALTVSPGIAAAPVSLAFSQIHGGAAQPAQTVQLTASGTTTPFTVTTKTNDGAAWLQAAPGSGTAPAALQVSTIAANLPEGEYNGTIVVSSSNGVLPASVAVKLTVLPAPPTPVIVAIGNAAGYSTAGISPGENILIGGTVLGPTTLAGSQLTGAGGLATTVGDTQVLFGSTPAPIIYASATQTSVMVPYEIAGQTSVTIQVSYKGVQSQRVTYPIKAAVPGIYTQDQTGSGPGAIVNQDGVTVNSAAAPAAKGSVVAVYMTGEGVTTPASVTGSIAPTDGSGLNQPNLPVSATVGGIPAVVEYAGSAPGIVYGVMQVNVRVPSGAPAGAQPIVIAVGNASTQQGVMLEVR